ncbi:MAG: outer membrane lipoprotein carrier protein LolA [Desulfovibrionaceae bacterium]|nr:outer membrane lipoprotein carrier protein LolA [Desulfovibrionaceae bacterium]
MRKVLFCLCLLSMVWARPAGASDLPDLIQKRYETVESFKADFDQELTHAASGQQELRHGQIWFKQPGLVRWQIEDPEELFVVARDHVWEYVAEDRIAIKHKAQDLFKSEIMLRILSGRANLKDDFKVEDQGEDQGLTKVKLVPHKPEMNMVLAYIWVDPKSYLMRRVLVVSFYGDGNQVALKNLKTGVAIPAKTFEFSPPPGVEVQDNTQGQAGRPDF